MTAIVAALAPVGLVIALGWGLQRAGFPGDGLWLAMQQAYDLWHAERRLRDQLEQIPTHAV